MSATGNILSDYTDDAPLPNLLSSIADLGKQKQEKQLQADANTKGFGKIDTKCFQRILDGARVEYYSQSYGEWIPAIVVDVQPNGCLKLLHDDGDLLKKEADPKSVRLAREQGNVQQVKLSASLSELTLTEQRASEALGSIIASMGSKAYDMSVMLWSVRSDAAHAKRPTKTKGKETYDWQMKHLHSLSEKCDAQLKIHRGLSADIVPDQQLKLNHLEFRHSLSKAVGPDVINHMHSSDQLMQQMGLRHGLSSMHDQHLKLDQSLSEGIGSVLSTSNSQM
eukprot:gnl/MRDRNA2_/MRDRNA2_58055_c0_seq1.p1 gnl/MRDRNA2_/MRDRNA2_58055_c0~~gnl/MRDRNA2_/MRDRNA2_58055_c0_seq1.p1  ORF type:complete len:304 (+),score=62.23 gnl/MRDRNA2_/MRDRNA2_58055_c0_seq1:75-914(+)